MLVPSRVGREVARFEPPLYRVTCEIQSLGLPTFGAFATLGEFRVLSD